MSKNGFSRREFLRTGAISTVALGSGLIGRQKQAIKSTSSPGDAKNVIFLVSDGMSSGTLSLADLLKQQQFGDKTNWIKLYESDSEYHRGLMDMASLDSVVTDSAAASSSWGSGKRINNGGVNWGPSNEQHKTICEIFRDAGKSTGLVSTARITHATPAGFGANVQSRSMEDEIAVQYLERGYDVLMGGGKRHFDSSRRRDGRDLYSDYEQQGYTVVKSRGELTRATRNSKLLGVFYDSHLPYTVDHRTLPELQQSVPTLAEMTDAALDRLSRNDDGFILQIEGGRVDHAAHGNCPSGLIYDQIAFDDAVKTVMDFTDGRDDTLVILTTDHGNANPGLSGLGSGYRESPGMLATLQNYRHSFEWIYDQLDYSYSDESISGVTVKRIMDIVEYAANTQITRSEALMVQQALMGKFSAPFRNRQGTGAVLAGVLANYNGIYFIGTNHTADYVELSAWGPGSDRIPGFARNTELFDLMVDMADVRAYAQG
ncbi:alkaline phosphatase [Rhodohalobacter mucosus]|uniref:Alkaline phosphatase n=1 Tax=Rhodohalobacter mucosus TaxID=2079485 RepID=A0A316TQ08_9BACT|nr:alkaline phosphatase [Rhodohalobacter mucosus]PWN05898.1 alkaline phosphatase [Rhodohalobacter mucosus]